MGGVNSSELDKKLKLIHDKLDDQGTTIKSLSSSSGDCGSCDISSITDTLSRIDHKLDDQGTTISSLSSRSGDGGSCDLLPISNTLGTIDSNLNNIIRGINGLNDNIVDSYYYITDQNSNIAYGLNLESQGFPGVEYYSVASGRAYNFSAGCDRPGREGDPHGWCDGPQQLFGLCGDQTLFPREGDNSVLGNYPIKSSDRTCHLQN